uniref:L1 transposable element RRM domain-containing protein n=1 Tax=Fundulus heteroclitus TaxID=8078 RepID=A0A3Q2PRN6_FUNHE
NQAHCERSSASTVWGIFVTHCHTMNRMTKPKPNKKDKSPGEETLDERTKLASLEVANANTSLMCSPGPSATNEDVLSAISKLSSTVDTRFVELNGSISSLKAALSDICDRVTSTEAAVGSQDRRISELEKRHDSLAAQWSLQQAKLEDLEVRSRRQNIRIIGIPERAENGRPTDFVCKLLPKLLGEDNFDRPIEVDRAHRSLTQAKDGKARAIIVRLHYFQERGCAAVAEGERSSAIRRLSVFIFTSAVMKKCQAFQAIREQCRSKRIRYGFRYPVQFMVTVNNNTTTFETPVEADKFLSREIEDWHKCPDCPSPYTEPIFRPFLNPAEIQKLFHPTAQFRCYLQKPKFLGKF